MARWSLAVILAISIVLSDLSRGEEFQCTNHVTEHCTCSKALGEYVLDCPHPPQEVQVITHFKPRESVEIMCTSKVSFKDEHWPTTLKYLSGLKFGKVKSFFVSMCPGMPPFPFKDIMDIVGATDVTEFFLVHMSRSQTNASEPLTREHLKGLENVKHLDLNTNKLTYLPEDLFADMPNLTWLDLKNNKVILPKNIFRSVPKLEVLELGSNNLTFLEPGIFRNLTKLRLLNLWGNRLHNLSRSVFTDIPNLESLDINSNHMISLVPDLFADLTNLKSLNLYNNNFFSLPRGLFLSNPKLEKIQLNHNRRNLRLPPGLLSNLPNLKEVKMSHCNLTELPEDLFYGSESITNITFKFNSISQLPGNLFRDTVKLLNVDLSHNRLISLPERVFSNLENLVVLNLAGNNITHIKEYSLWGLKALVDLNFEYNSLEGIHQSAFTMITNLKQINLSHNKLKDLKVRQVQFAGAEQDTFSVFFSQELEIINLSYNKLHEIYDDWKLSKLKIKKIDLSHNAFTEIEFSDLVFSSKYPELDLSNNNISIVNFDNAELIAKAGTRTENTSLKVRLSENPIRCDCNAYSFSKYIRGSMEPEVYYFVQVDPIGLSCKEDGDAPDLKERDPRQFICQVDEGCPNACKCFKRQHDTALLIDCSNANYTSPPDLNFFPLEITKSVNQTRVDLSNNRIVSLPANFNFIGYNKTTFLDLSHNKLRNISKTSLNPYLQELLLDSNNLTKLDNEVIKHLEKSKQLKKITLAGNRWTCNCEATNLLSFVQANYAKVVLKNLTCSNGMTIANMNVSDLCHTSNFLIGLTSLIIALLGLVVGGLVALYYRYQKEIKVWLYAHNMCLWFVTEEDLDKDKEFDAFVSYSNDDEEFIVNKLVPGLENGSIRYKLCLHYRDWIIGDPIPNQIVRSVQNSKRTIIVLSPAFMKSIWGLMEFRTAHQQALSEGRSRVILIIYGDIGPTDTLDPELKAYLAMNTYVKWDDPWFWERLRYALPHPAKNQNMPMTTLLETKPLKNGSTPTINSNLIESSKPV